MKTLVVGIGALGGIVAARLRAAGLPVSLATRDAASATALRVSGLRVTGAFGPIEVALDAPDVAALDAYAPSDGFELIVLATKAHDAIAIAPRLAELLAPGGTLLPIQNGGVSQLLADRLGEARVLGGLSNLGATMTAPGIFEQRNGGHLLIGELAGGTSARAERVHAHLSRVMEIRASTNLRGAVWSKLLLNCSVTTIGAIAGQTMRAYITTPEGRSLFDRSYDEALAVALASGAKPERMIVDPIPPGWNSASTDRHLHDAWLEEILHAYGDLKPSMLHDFEHGKRTEVDFINGYVARIGSELGIATPANTAITDVVNRITSGELTPSPTLLRL